MGVSRIINMIRNLKNWDAYLLYKMGGKKKDQFTFRLKNNYSVTVPRAIQPEFKESLFEEVYFKNLPGEILSNATTRLSWTSVPMSDFSPFPHYSN